MVLMFTDLVGSVELKMRLGNTAYVRLIARHDKILKQIVRSLPGASILKDTGELEEAQGIVERWNPVDEMSGPAFRCEQARRAALTRSLQCRRSRRRGHLRHWSPRRRSRQ